MSPVEKNRISIALCTCNGERFLFQQLTSIREQTRFPDEVVVCDDRSTDRTMAIVGEFAASAPFPVRVVENQKNLGSTKNFEQAIRLCTGDLIALSDQDDVWYPERLERSEEELLAHPNAGMVFSDADLIDERDRLLDGTLWRSIGFSGDRKQRFLAHDYEFIAKHRFVTGATVLFRATLRDLCLPVGEGWIHDEWLALMLAAFVDLLPIDEALMRYRVHDTQQIGLVNKWQRRLQSKAFAEKHWARISGCAKEMRELCDRLPITPSAGRSEILSAYRDYLQFLSFRSELPTLRLARIAPILRRLFWYSKHASGWASAAKDLVIGRPADL